ncbi:hypothetical protein [Rhizobium phage RHph_X3_2]|nr:hypothetical protein [Rhizobium phage RHph_X3_2]
MSRFSVTKNLDPLKVTACAQVDRMAETCRGKYITPGAGQAMVYVQKEKEAELLMADPNVSEDLIPHIVTEATVANITLQAMANIILTRAAQWRMVSPPIEVTRLTTKQQIMAATSPVEIDALVAQAKSIFEQTA